MERKKRIGSLVCVILAVLLCLCGCEAKQTAANHTATSAAADLSAAEKLGEGSRQFYFTVTFADGTGKAYDIATDETTVGAALAALDLAQGEQTQYGLFVKTVCGVRADYDLDNAYWAFYIDGEYAMTGVDGADITDGGVYAFVYTPADQF
ncbi:MAG: DUF4430 domain-containing protein [Clostridia bacterium]|nr:DUF4430 domain-containing protein [Clostridia bacterium]